MRLFRSPRRGEGCEHLPSVDRAVPPMTTEGCQGCLTEGTRWVALRACLTCGHVGCCDSSPRKHARRHFSETHHPIIRSTVQPGDGWTWCYVDDAYV